MHPFRWVASFILIGLAVAGTFLVVAYLFPGETFIDRLGAAYKVVWENTTQRQFTFIMRDNPWLLICVWIVATNELLGKRRVRLSLLRDWISSSW